LQALSYPPKTRNDFQIYNLIKMLNLVSISSTSKYYFAVVLVTLSLIGLLFLVEIILKLNEVPYDNVNLIIRRWAFHRFYFITFLAGIISGHLFLGTTTEWVDCNKLGLKSLCYMFDVLVITALTTIVLIVGLFTQKKTTKKITQYILYALGVIVGHFLWSLNSYS